VSVRAKVALLVCREDEIEVKKKEKDAKFPETAT
jgi:hypothetical protein